MSLFRDRWRSPHLRTAQEKVPVPCPAHCVVLPADFSAPPSHRHSKTKSSPCPSSKPWPSRPPRCHADCHVRCHACCVRQLCPGHAPMTCSDCRSSELAGSCAPSCRNKQARRRPGQGAGACVPPGRQDMHSRPGHSARFITLRGVLRPGHCPAHGRKRGSAH